MTVPGVGRVEAGEDPQQRASCRCRSARRRRSGCAGRSCTITRSSTTCGPNDLVMSRATRLASELRAGGERGHGGTCGSRAGREGSGRAGSLHRAGRIARVDDDDPARISTGSSSTRTASASAAGSSAPAMPATRSRGARLVDVELVRCDLVGLRLLRGGVRTGCASSTAGASAIELGGATWRDGHRRRLPARRRELPARAAARRCASRRRCCARADFGGARLEDVQFPGCDLAGADFSNARCADVDLRGARLDGLQGVGSLRGRDDRRRPAVRARARAGRGARAAVRADDD